MKQKIYIVNEFSTNGIADEDFDIPTIALTDRREAVKLLRQLEKNSKLKSSFSIVELNLVNKASEAIGNRSYNGWKIE